MTTNKNEETLKQYLDRITQDKTKTDQEEKKQTWLNEWRF